ncbi:hypothetical protein PYW07_016592 [Mythimna separata]|uniref:Uncharacterized protein n=1 Tax=Mythimna separata TaxID=271217 RepID=A0AAD7YJW2_MYTSE|nr:hypothetical protein PYW07_016592 [Mythimna separata]
MSEEDISVIARAETRKKTKGFKKAVKVNEAQQWTNRFSDPEPKDDKKAKKTLLRRLPSVQKAVIPAFGRFRHSFRKLNCFNKQEEDELPMMDIPRHKSIDIGVGLARRVSLFLFTRRTVCVHPYHPYTPPQTTRKIYVFSEDK